MTPISGSIRLLFSDVNDVNRTLYGIASAQLTIESSSIEAASPAGNDWRSPSVELRSWSAQTTGNIELTSDLLPDATQDAIEDVALQKKIIAVEFRSNTGAIYVGRALVTRLSLDTSEESVQRQLVSLQGIGPLEKISIGANWCPSTQYTIRYWSFYGDPLSLGASPGWIRVAITANSSSMLSLRVYRGATELFEMVGSPLTPGTDGWFYWDPPVGGPYSIRFEFTPNGIPFAPEYRCNVYCPGEGGEPPT